MRGVSPQDIRTRLNWKKENWVALEEKIKIRIRNDQWDAFLWDHVPNSTELFNHIDDFQKCLMDEAAHHVPKNQPTNNSKPWWTQNVKIKHAEHLRAQKRLKQYKRRHKFPVNQDLKMTAQHARKKFKDTLEEAKQTHWRKITGDLTPDNCWRFTKYLRQKTNQVHSSFVRLDDDEVISDPQTINKHLGNKFFPKNNVELDDSHQALESRVNH